MKKLFGHKGPKGGKATGSRDYSEEGGLKPPVSTPLYQKLATHGNHVGPGPNQGPGGAVEDERWEVVPPVSPNDPALLPNLHPPTITAPSRTSSFGSVNPGAPPGAGIPPPAQMPMLVGAPAQSPLPPPPRSASPMSSVTNISSSNKLIKNRDRERDAYMQAQAAAQGGGGRKKAPPTAPVAVGILRALDPPNGAPEERDRRTVSESGHASYRDHRNEREPPPPVEKDGKDIRKDDKKRGFWGSRDKDKDREKEREKALEREREKERERVRERERELQFHARDVMQREPMKERMPYDERGREPALGRDLRREEDGQAELTRMIGYLTATASEDWTLVLDVCDRASASDANAREAVRALRREFKYGEPAAQLSAARLWAIMLRNSSDIFISQSTSRKFLDTLEDLLSSSRTSPVVRERLLEVVAAAAYASGNKKGNERDGFKGLWKRVKPFDKPDEGVPFDTDDAMFHPPTSASTRLSGYENINIPIVAYQEPTPTGLESAPLTPSGPNPIKSKRRSPTDRTDNSTTRNRIIPPEEDMRRLFQECKIGQGNASLLAQALVAARPEDLKKEGIIKEFYVKCRASQELIFAQIPWASAGAERAIAHKPEKPSKEKSHTRKRTLSNSKDPSAKLRKDRSNSPEDEEGTMEEKLLAALLAANAELQEALRLYEDLERVAMERKAEDRSRKEVRMDARQRERLAAERELSVSSAALGDGPAGGSSRTPSPPSRSHSPQHTPQQANHQAYPFQNQNAQTPPLAHPRPKHLALSDSELDPNYLLAVGGVGGQNPTLAPPPAAPHGPRSPAQASVHSYSNSQGHHSRASSPGTASLVEPYAYAYTNGNAGGQGQWHGGGQSQGQGQRYGSGHGHGNEFDDIYGEDGEGYEFDAPPKPSAKALGKRKVVEPDTPSGPQFDANDMYSSSNLNRPSSFAPVHDHDPEFDDDDNHAWPHPPVQFVYDAVAERTKQWHEGAQKEIVGGAGTGANGAH